MKTILSLLFILTLSINYASPRADHSLWDELLKQYVTSAGRVDYKNFKINKNTVSAYLKELKAHTPGTDWTKNEKMAYYINMYNAYTVQFIISKYPVKSPKDVSYSGKDIWHLKLVELGNKKLTLTMVEDILRGYGDPRIHFAINCGAVSCPKLLNRAYKAETLNKDLTTQTKNFINNSTKNIIREKKIQISKIFEWYAVDFKTEKTGVIDFINKYSKVQISPKAKIEYLPYSWALNG
ncbi:MAG TPA: DUF547 domain-containing protein [Crocinitomix sp.]|nr:DUF547 domain-containing protein [Crocinitomix sp.]